MARLAVEEGCNLDVSTGGEYHVARAAGVPADRLVLHGNNKSTDELRRALAEGVGRIVVDSFDELDRIEALVAEGLPAAEGAPPRHARGRGPHPRVRPDRPGRLEVRLRAGQRAGRAGRAAGRRRRPRSTSSACTPTSGRRCSRPGSSSWRSRSWPRSCSATGCPSSRSGGGLGVAYVEGEEAPTITEWGKAVHAGRAPPPASPPPITAEPGRAIVAQAARHPLHRGHGQGPPRHPHLRRGRRRHERQPPAGALRQRLRGVPAARGRRRPARAGSRSWASTASPATCWSARPRCPTDLAVGDILATPVTGAYGHSMGSTTTRSPAPRWCSWPTATPASSCAARPSTTCSASTSAEVSGGAEGVDHVGVEPVGDQDLLDDAVLLGR